MNDKNQKPVAQVVLEMQQRFTSGNSVPVSSARINKADWDVILSALRKAGIAA